MRIILIISIIIVKSLFISVFSQNIDTLKTQEEETIKQVIKPAHVVFMGDSLFTINANFGPFTPEERVTLINEHLNSLANQIMVVEDSFNIVEKHNYSLVSYKGFSIMTISDEDVIHLGVPRRQAVEEYVGIIKASFKEHITHKSLVEWLISIGFTILTLLGLPENTLSPKKL